jgi:hypothetical protein
VLHYEHISGAVSTIFHSHPRHEDRPRLPAAAPQTANNYTPGVLFVKYLIGCFTYFFQKPRFLGKNSRFSQENKPPTFQNNRFSLENSPATFQNNLLSQKNKPLTFQNSRFSQENKPFTFQNNLLSQENKPFTFQNNLFSLENSPLAFKTLTQKKEITQHESKNRLDVRFPNRTIKYGPQAPRQHPHPKRNPHSTGKHRDLSGGTA